MTDCIGVLALQGAYQKHVDMLSKLDVESRLVRWAHELDECSALIIPGGESTTMSLMIQKNDLHQALYDFASSKPVMGVCAGAILMADTVDDTRVTPLNILPIKAKRNYYGRQVHSFSTELSLACDANGSAYPAYFIRAPKVESSNKKIEVLAEHENDAVLLRMGWHIAMTFHPELTNDSRVHTCWLKSFHPLFLQEHHASL